MAILRAARCGATLPALAASADLGVRRRGAQKLFPWRGVSAPGALALGAQTQEARLVDGARKFETNP